MTGAVLCYGNRTTSYRTSMQASRNAGAAHPPSAIPASATGSFAVRIHVTVTAARTL